MGDGENFRAFTFQSSQFIVRLHPMHERKLQSPSAGLTCSCGTLKIQVAWIPDADVPESAVMVSSRVADALRFRQMPNELPALVMDRRLHIGPTIGVLCNPHWNAQSGTLYTSKQLPALQKLMEAGQEAGALCYLFRVEDVDFTRSIVKAYRWTGEHWVQGTFPLPDVIYDQVVSRKAERDPSLMGKRIALSKRYGAKIFNDGFFDKWQVNEWLTEDAKLRHHVPETKRYTTPQAASLFIGRHAMTYLKPVHGSLGLGIVRMVKQQDGSIAYDLKRKTQPPLHGKSANTVEAVRTFRKRLKSRPYLMQQGIYLATFKDRPFDIRIIVQRDETGLWRRTKMFARVSKPGDITSNLSSGGEALPVNVVFKEIYKRPDEERKIQRQIRNVTQTITDCLEKESGKPFGELGIDLGVDHTGQIWVIEVNSKPWKSATTERGRQDLVDLAFERPMRYAIYLSKQK